MKDGMTGAAGWIFGDRRGRARRQSGIRKLRIVRAGVEIDLFADVESTAVDINIKPNE